MRGDVRRGKRRGSVLIEFALIFTVMLLLTLGVVDFALVIQRSMVINEAAYAAAQWGAIAPNSTNLTGMQALATQSATGISGFSAVATKWCACSPGGTSVACTSTCTSYGAPVAYVQVATSATVPVLFRYSVIPASIPVSGLCIMRVQ